MMKETQRNINTINKTQHIKLKIRSLETVQNPVWKHILKQKKNSSYFTSGISWHAKGSYNTFFGDVTIEKDSTGLQPLFIYLFFDLYTITDMMLLHRHGKLTQRNSNEIVCCEWFLCPMVGIYKEVSKTSVLDGVSKILWTYHEFVDRYGLYISQMTTDVSKLS